MNLKIEFTRLVIVGAFAALAAGQAFADDSENNLPTISVTGNAEIKVDPDEAVLAFSIENRKQTLDESVAVNAQAIEKAMKFLQAQGVEEKNIRTDVVRIRPIYKTQAQAKGWRPQQVLPAPNAAIVDRNPLGDAEEQLKPIGYEARRGISVTISDLSKLEGIYTGLLKNGVNEVSRVSFQTTQLRKFRDEARLKAIRAAREKAKALSGELGAKLAGVLRISESNWSPGPSFGQNSISLAPRGMSSGSTMSRGTINVNATVSVVFVLGNNKF